MTRRPRVVQQPGLFDGGGDDVAPVTASGHTDDALLVARYGGGWRYTVNPPTRRDRMRNGETAPVWSAGGAEDWCQVNDPAELAGGGLHGPVARWMAQHPGAGRIERQRGCHAVTPCARRGRHWPEREDDPD